MEIVNNKLDGYSNRAIVVKDEKGRDYLISYHTIVAYKGPRGAFHKLWNGYSRTTNVNHLAKFGGHYSKKEWNSLKTEKLPKDLNALETMALQILCDRKVNA